MVTISPGNNDFITVNIRDDGIALEEDETFQLRLVVNTPPTLLREAFCLDTLNLIIEDSNGRNDQTYTYKGILFIVCMHALKRALLYSLNDENGTAYFSCFFSLAYFIQR